jgi:hypothetical protein
MPSTSLKNGAIFLTLFKLYVLLAIFDIFLQAVSYTSALSGPWKKRKKMRVIKGGGGTAIPSFFTVYVTFYFNLLLEKIRYGKGPPNGRGKLQ